MVWCWCCSCLDRWGWAGSGTGTCSRNRRRGLGRRLDFTARLLLLLLLLGLSTCSLLLRPLSVLLLVLLGDVLEAGLDVPCAAAGWPVKNWTSDKFTLALIKVLTLIHLMLIKAHQPPQVWFSYKTGSASPHPRMSLHSVQQRHEDIRKSSLCTITQQI